MSVMEFPAAQPVPVQPGGAQPATTPVLSVRSLSTSFRTPGGRVHAVRDVSFDIRPGEIIGLVGESGSGKTVTGLSLLRLLPETAQTAGSVTFDGRDVMKMKPGELRRLRGDGISMIFQDPMTSLDPVFTVQSQLVGVMRAHQEISKDAARARATDLLRQVGIADVQTRLHQYPHQMSGGMRQRVLIAMALANNPKLLIADEPTTALDVTIQAQILRLLKDINARTGMSIILVTHDLGVVAGLCDRIFVMYGGRLVEAGPARAVYKHPEHPYTTGLLNSVIGPKADRSQPLQVIEGMPPVLLDPKPGCPFAPRCDYSVDRCFEESPEFTMRGHEHGAACFVTEGGSGVGV
jgi:peptide/nickel transport system ATP-binding protein/oligopeptide transport system ATP-binding protein